MTIEVTHNDNSKKCYNNIEDIIDNNNVIRLDIYYTNLTELSNLNFPNLIHFNCSSNNNLKELSNLNFPNLTHFYCSSNNNLTELPGLYFPNLTYFDCSYNNLTELPELNFPNLRDFYCSNNKLTKLPELNFPNLTQFYCNNNKLTKLPELNFPNLTYFSCSNNKLTELHELNFPNLIEFYCYDNNLTTLPLSLMNCNQLINIEIQNNPLVLPLQLTRFINRIQNTNTNKINIYNDSQNIHNTNIQLTVKDSINRITTRTDIEPYNRDKLIMLIVNDNYLDCKEQLICYIEDESVHTLLLLTFGEVLWYVLNTINKDFNLEEQKEIKLILNEEMKDSTCKCFTGRITRVINCLNGFSPLVSIQIKDESQIGNIIIMVRDRLGENYNIDEHKRIVREELMERNYYKDVINKWLEYIE